MLPILVGNETLLFEHIAAILASIVMLSWEIKPRRSKRDIDTTLTVVCFSILFFGAYVFLAIGGAIVIEKLFSQLKVLSNAAISKIL